MTLTCSRCRIKMIQKRGSHHKRRKWVCPRCGGVRMQDPKEPPIAKRSDQDE